MAMTGGTAKLVSQGTPPGWPGPISLYVYYKEVSQDINTNETTLSLGMYVTTPSGWYFGPWKDYYGSYIGTATSGANSKTFDGSCPSNTQGTRWLVENQTVTVKHEDDGSKTVTIYWHWGVNSGWAGVMANASGAFSVKLTTIPRAATITVTDANIESACIISVARPNSTFTTTVSYKASGQSSYTTIWTKQAHSSYGWTVPASLYSLIPKARTMQIEFRCQTYNGSTLVGTSTTTMTATAAADKCQPVTTISAKDIREATIALTGNNRRVIKGVSTLEVTCTAKAQKSASLVDTTVTCGTKQQVKTGESFVVTFAKAESETASSATKDSRDYVTWNKDVLTLVNYVSPTANPITARESPTSDVVFVEVKGIWFNGNFGAVSNSLSLKVRTKPKGQEAFTSAYTNMTVTAEGNNYTAEARLTGLVYTQAYDVEIAINDAVHTGSLEPTLLKYDEVRKGIPIFDWGENDFNVNGALMINGTLNVAEELEKFSKYVVRKSWWGASGDVLDTGIPAKGESYGKTILMVLSAHSGSGTATTSEVGMIWCGFDSGTIAYTHLASISGGSSVGSQFTFTVGSNGNIHLKGNRPVISMTAIISD